MGANLLNANLIGANLESFNLSGANLSGANLKKVQALFANFEGVTLTGACIEDWNINSQTNFQNVKCECIYLKSISFKEENNWIYRDRRPHDHNKNFAPGEFTKLFQKAKEYKKLLQAKDKDIVYFRQQNTNLLDIIKVQASGLSALIL